MLKKFAVWLVKNLIIILLITLIFSSVVIDFPNLLQGVFSDIFDYASPDMQKRVVNGLTETCSSLGQDSGAVTLMQVCSNATMLQSMRQNCKNYRELKRKGMQFENEAELQESCYKIESGEIDEACKSMKESFMPDLSDIGASCRDYQTGKINDRQFFFNVVGSILPKSYSELPQIGFLEKYNKIVNSLNENKLLYIFVLAILGALLYLLLKDTNLFLRELSGICLSIGILILLPYLGIILYDKLVGIDTTAILGSMFGSGFGFDLKAIVSLILLLFLRTYNSSIITIGILLTAVGAGGKFYGVFKKRKAPKSSGRKNDKKMDKLSKELKVEMKKKG